MKGKILERVEWNEDEIKIFTKCGDTYSATAQGECCSESFICHIDEPVLGAEILDDTMREIDLPSQENICSLPRKDHENDVETQYFYKLRTTKGDLIVEMRNYSNGYYGGWLYGNLTAPLDCRDCCE